MKHSPRQTKSAHRQEPGTGGYFLSDAELAARAATTPVLAAAVAAEKSAAATPAELQQLQQQYAALSNLEYAVGNRQRWSRWMWGLALMLILSAAAGLVAFSWMRPVPEPASVSRPANGGVANEEIPPPATASVGSAGATSSAKSPTPVTPEVRPQPVVASTAITDTKKPELTGTPRLLTGPATSKKAGHYQPDRAAVKHEPAVDANPAQSCSAAALAMALCDVKGR